MKPRQKRPPWPVQECPVLYRTHERSWDHSRALDTLIERLAQSFRLRGVTRTQWITQYTQDEKDVLKAHKVGNPGARATWEVVFGLGSNARKWLRPGVEDYRGLSFAQILEVRRQMVRHFPRNFEEFGKSPLAPIAYEDRHKANPFEAFDASINELWWPPDQPYKAPPPLPDPALSCVDFPTPDSASTAPPPSAEPSLSSHDPGAKQPVLGAASTSALGSVVRRSRSGAASLRELGRPCAAVFLLVLSAFLLLQDKRGDSTRGPTLAELLRKPDSTSPRPGYAFADDQDANWDDQDTDWGDGWFAAPDRKNIPTTKATPHRQGAVRPSPTITLTTSEIPVLYPRSI